MACQAIGTQQRREGKGRYGVLVIPVVCFRAVPNTGTTAGCFNVANMDSSRLKRSRSAEVAMRHRLIATGWHRHRPRNTVLSAPSDILPAEVRKIPRVSYYFLPR